ncbi:MAG: L,D-transpeptidase family protein, partial [Phycisphaerae bacterium]
PVPAGPGEAMADEGLALFAAGRLVEAQKRLSEALRAGVGGAKGKALRDALGRCSERLQFSRQVGVPGDPYSKTYDIASGDTLTTIGQKFLVPYELIMRVNGLTSTSIYADQPLKVLQGPIHAEVLKSAYELRVWLGDVCLVVCPVGLGAGDSTPEGTYLVEKKLKNPPYQPQHKPRSEFRPSGHPENPLGTRWIDIGNHYGLHGTIDPASIGGNVSEGCIRMHSRDVEMLYDMVVPGVSKVTIRP